MKSATVILIVCFFCIGMFAQTPYSTNAVFKSGEPTEGVDHLSLILSAYPEQYDFQSNLLIDRSLKFLYQELEASKINKKKLDKKIPLITKIVEGAYLNAYVPGVDFELLIRKGYYNDITATSLYALVFEYLNIPYAIQIEEYQVYPVVDPYGQRIPITIPGVMFPKDGREDTFAQKYVELLEEMQMLKNGESTMNSLESLFQRYYFSQRQFINFTQLPGLVYWRSALGHYQNEEYDLALAKLDMAQQILPMPRHQPFRIACLFQLAAAFNPDNPQSFSDLFKLYESHPVPLVEDEILALFIGISENQLFNYRQMDQFEQSYQFFLKKANDKSQLKQKLQTVYLLQKAKYFSKTANYDQVFLLADSIFQQQPKNEAVQEVLAGLFKGEFNHGRDFHKGLEQIYAYRQKYPYLKHHKGIQDLELFYAAERIRYYFGQDNESSGVYFLNEFENLVSQYGKTARVEQWIKTAYIAASDYYCRMNEFQQARQMTHNAAQLLPDDPYFKHRVELLSFYP